MATERRAFLGAILESAGPSYYVVHFDEDDCIARVPRKLVLKPARPSVGETCSIEWSNGVEYTATVLAMGDAATTKKAELELARKQGKENQEPVPKRKKESQTSRTPSRKTTSKKRKPLEKTQTSKTVSSTPDFELGPPAPGSSPPSCAKAKEKPAELAVSLSGFSTDDSTLSDAMLSDDSVEKVMTITIDDECTDPSPPHKISFESDFHTEQCCHHREILQKLDDLTSAVKGFDNRLSSVLSYLTDLERTQSSAGQQAPVPFIGPHEMPTPTAPVTPTQPRTQVPATVTSIGQPHVPTPVPFIPPPTAPVTPTQPRTQIPATVTSIGQPHVPPTPVPFIPPPTAPVTPTQPRTQVPANVASTDYIGVDEVMRIKCASSSRMNFAANVNRRIFTIAERTQCNVRGKLGKGMLDKEKIDYIKLMAFRMFPLESSKETEKAAWNACITAIDEVNRRLNKPPKK